MTIVVRERSRITAKGQTTVPKVVRQALGVSYGGEIAYVVDETGAVSLVAASDRTDPVIDGFLSFLARDMIENPGRLVAVPSGLAERMSVLAAGVDDDPDQEIDGDVGL